MEAILEYVAAAAILFGVFFFIVGIVGFIRFPDVYTRIHASGKLSTLGMIGLLIGTAILEPDAALRLLALAVFIITTQPVASQVVASAAYRSGVRMEESARDDLAGVIKPNTTPPDEQASRAPAGD